MYKLIFFSLLYTYNPALRRHNFQPFRSRVSVPNLKNVRGPTHIKIYIFDTR